MSHISWDKETRFYQQIGDCGYILRSGISSDDNYHLKTQNETQKILVTEFFDTIDCTVLFQHYLLLQNRKHIFIIVDYE